MFFILATCAFLKNLSNLILFSSLIFFGFLFLNYPVWGNLNGEMVFNLLDSNMSQVLIALSAWVTLFMILASPSALIKTAIYLQLLIKMMFVLFVCFKVNSLILFYYSFEVALLPIFFLIMGWGYQPERLSASINLFLYTVFASLPLLVCFLILTNFFYAAEFSDMEKLSSPNKSTSIMNASVLISLLAGFLVKYPLFSVHLWLPKAHVEAPVAGSMILAAILLKLGGYGMLRLTPLFSVFSKVIISLLAFSLAGGAVISALCLRQTDVKTLIAYSSVAHMSLVISASLTLTAWGAAGAYLLMIAHGITSSGLFSAANVLYERWKTRNMLLSKSVMNFIPVFTLWWFLLCVCNMGGPPSINLLSEVMSLVSILNASFKLTPLLMFITGLAVAYSLILYASSQQGQFSFSKTNSGVLSLREVSLMFSHVLPSFILSFVVYLVLS